MSAKCSICHKVFRSIEVFESYNCTNEYHSNSDVEDQLENHGLQFTFAVVGAPESGKSYYIYSLIQQLFEQPDDIVRDYMSKLKMWVDFVGEQSITQYETFKSLMFSDDKLESTAQEAPENHIPITLNISVGEYPNRKSIKLSFFDISGEKFLDRNFLETEPRIHRAKGIIFLIDPYSDEKLNQLLENYNQNSGERFNIIENLHRAISKNANRRIRLSKITTPVAFCISMFDLLEHHVPDKIPQKPYLEINDLITKRNKFNQKLSNMKSLELKYFLKENSRIPINRIEDRFSKYALFAISSIGHGDAYNIGSKGSLNSKGILAPLLWLLGQSSILDKN